MEERDQPGFYAYFFAGLFLQSLFDHPVMPKLLYSISTPSKAVFQAYLKSSLIEAKEALDSVFSP